MARVLGVGGVFFRCKDADATRDWYKRMLGLTMNEYGGTDFIHSDTAKAFPKAARTVFAPFAADTDYFQPSKADWMMNLLVDDLMGVLDHIREVGGQLEGEILDEPYGKFAWILDPDGRKVELWQPVEDVPAK